MKARLKSPLALSISLEDHFLVWSRWTSFHVPLNSTLSFCQRTTLLDDFSPSTLLANSHVAGHWQAC